MTVCPCRPSAQVEAPFYEEWWFLLVMALSSLIVILLVVFALVLHGQNRKYKNCSTGGLPPPTPASQRGSSASPSRICAAHVTFRLIP